MMALALSALDIFAACRRLISFFRSPDKSLANFWQHVIRKEPLGSSIPEYSGIITEEPQDMDLSPRHSSELEVIPLTTTTGHEHTEQWANNVHRHQRKYSQISEGTVFGSHSPAHSQDTFIKAKSWSSTKGSRLDGIGKVIFAVLERSLILAGFAQVLMGIVTYTGQYHSVEIQVL
jgi:hypothetical protein